MGSYFIESFKITKLWGYREDINLTFNNDVNVLIGPNGSGKTTVLTLLNSILSLDLSGLLNVNFEYAEIHLRDFKDSSVLRTVKVDAANRLLRLRLDEKETNIDTESITGHRFTEHRRQLGKGNTLPERLPERFVRRTIVPEKFYDELTSLVPIVWLPISRHLPTVVGEEERYTRRDPPESVDSRIPQLLNYDLSRYYNGLTAQLSERYREFEHRVLSVILYSKGDDQLQSILDSLPSSLPTKAEKEQLLRALETTKLSGKGMRSRIDEHFAVAEKVVKRTRENPGVFEDEDILVLPLIPRTQAMVKYAGKLEEDRENIFAPLRFYEKTVNSFLEDKFIEIDGSGELKIRLSSSLELDWHLLSSGEKQILILLTQAFLRIDEPVVYMADEPELSLHVTWQEKLLESLVTLGGQKQIIVATHSPDIVGDFRDKVIDLGRES
jgi:predicted ATP-dependent endonuclease of OLD family